MNRFLDKLKLSWQDPKSRNLIVNLIGTVGVKGLALALTMFTMPSYIRYFDNNTALGVWFSLVSILNWILTFDLGIGNGLRNHLVPALNSKNTYEIKTLISSAYFFLGVLTLLAALVGLVVLPFLNMNVLLNVGEDVISREQLTLGVAIIFIGMMVRFFLQLITSIFYAMQKTALPNLITLISSVLILLYINVFSFDAVGTKFVMLALAQSLALCLPLFLSTVWVFMTSLKDERPSVNNIKWSLGKKVVSLGGEFFIIQICLMVITSTNSILVNNLTTPDAAVEYQAYHRIFYMVMTMFSLLIQPMWSAFSQANAEKNYKWVKNIYRKFNLLAALATFGCLVLAVIFQWVVNIWLGADAFEVHLSYSLCFAAWIGADLFIHSATCVANGLNELKCQIIWTAVGAVVKIPLSILFVNLTGSWIGVVLANVAALLPLLVCQVYDSHHKLKIKIRAAESDTLKEGC